MIHTFPEAIIFDWDGTLVDTHANILLAFNTTFEHFGLATIDRDELEKNYTNAHAFPNRFGDKCEEALLMYRAHYKSLSKTTPPQKQMGAENLLQWLKLSKVPSFVVSAKTHSILLEEIEACGWQDRFIDAIGSWEIAHNKPERGVVDHVLGKAGFQAHSGIWFIGDTDTDLECAHNAGCSGVAINRTLPFEKHQPAMKLAHCIDLHTHLVNLHKQGA